MYQRRHTNRQTEDKDRSSANKSSKDGLAIPAISVPVQFVNDAKLSKEKSEFGGRFSYETSYQHTESPVQLMSFDKKKMTSKVLASTVDKHVAANKEEAITKFIKRKGQKRQSFVDSEDALTSIVDGDSRDAKETNIINRQMNVRYLETNSDNPTKEDIRHYDPTKWMCELGVDKVKKGDEEYLSIFHFKSRD